jgi:hypothetical protein
MSNGNVVANPGWEEDIAGIFYPFIEQMMWRFDLSRYEDVRANANVILGRINGGGMPPPNFPPLSNDQITTYENWVNNDCPLNRPPAAPAPAAAAPPATMLAGNQQPRPVKFP